MTREIKFRVWDTKRKEWKSRSNVYVNGHGEKAWIFGFDYEPCGEVELSQYTGFKDKNGEEIYEGDITNFGIVVWASVVGSEQGAGVVTPCFALKTADSYFPKPINDFAEIVGNIYENPELLNNQGTD